MKIYSLISYEKNYIIGVMDMDVSYETILRFPALSYATGKNRELLNLSSMGR